LWRRSCSLPHSLLIASLVWLFKSDFCIFINFFSSHF
jgi:hypothetical protein